MTISNNIPSISYKGNGLCKTFQIPFSAMKKEDLAISCLTASGADYALLAGTDYSIRPEKYMPGALAIEFTKPFPLDWIMTISRKTPIEQENIFHNQGPNYPKTIESSLDRLTMICQELSLSVSSLAISDLFLQQKEMSSAIKTLEKEVDKKADRETLQDALRVMENRLTGLMPTAPEDGRLYAAAGCVWVPVPEGGDPFAVDDDNHIVATVRKHYSPNPLWHIGPSYVSPAQSAEAGDEDSLFTVDSENFYTVKI